MRATHKKWNAIIGNQVVPLNPGQFIFGRKRAGHDTPLSEQTIRTAIKVLVSNQQISVKSTNKYSIITVINWDIYQPEESDTNQQITSNITNKEPTNNQQITTYKNIKNIKNINTSPADADILKKIKQISDWLYEKKRFPKVHAFVNKMLKENKNKSAVLHTLEQLKKSGLSGNSVCWRYCTKIMGVENGNFNEAQYRENAARQKRDLEEWEEKITSKSI
jgi:hypothetical protein